MISGITLFGRTVEPYGLMTVLGIIAVTVYLAYIECSVRNDAADMELTAISAAVGAVTGSKLLYCLVSLPELIHMAPSDILTSVINGGFVFYGGFYGAWLGARLYCSYAHVDFDSMLRYLFPAVPLFHFFGRIGCFLTGCCYGIPSPVGVVYHYSVIAPNGIRLFPVQFIEAFVELALFIVLFRMMRNGRDGYYMLSVWLIIYGVIRFVLLSTSQWIAIVSVIVGLYLLMRTGKNGAVLEW